jgi:1-acyl-sn-glycerol-3-phosphate acyltransferase
MVALEPSVDEPTRRKRLPKSTPLVWRACLQIDRALVGVTGRVQVSGTVPDELRGRAVLLPVNHIGVFDVFVLIAACRKMGIAPRFMATGGLFDAPVLGWIMRRSGHLRVNRGKANVVEAFRIAVDALTHSPGPVMMYPEGKISLDPGLWPERGKTGAARMALASGLPVLPVSQWGAHEAVYWGSEVVSGWSDVKPLITSWGRSVRRRPVFKVHFGAPVDLSGLSIDKPGDAVRAHERIMRAITAGLIPLRPDEPDAPAFHDPTRPTTGRSPWRPR